MVHASDRVRPDGRAAQNGEAEGADASEPPGVALGGGNDLIPAVKGGGRALSRRFRAGSRYRRA